MAFCKIEKIFLEKRIIVRIIEKRTMLTPKRNFIEKRKERKKKRRKKIKLNYHTTIL